jgi:hypothetical protein
VSVNASEALRPDALEANRRGELSESQIQGFGSLATRRRKSGLQFAVIFIVMGVLIGFFASPGKPIATRALLTLGCFAIAAFLIVRSVTGADALTRDLRRRKVQSVEGAIGKSQMSASGSDEVYFLDVGDSRFTVARATYAGAPDAGHVRLYFLPLSRKVVNLERLADAPLPASGVSVQDVMQSVGASLKAGNRRERNEARAELAGFSNAVKAAFAPPSEAAPSGSRDPRPLAQAILGTWSNGFVTVTFHSDGRASTNTMGREKPGRWSVDAQGRLHADVADRQIVAEAWVAGDELVVSTEGQVLTLRRKS